MEYQTSLYIFTSIIFNLFWGFDRSDPKFSMDFDSWKLNRFLIKFDVFLETNQSCDYFVDGRGRAKKFKCLIWEEFSPFVSTQNSIFFETVFISGTKFPTWSVILPLQEEIHSFHSENLKNDVFEIEISLNKTM